MQSEEVNLTSNIDALVCVDTLYTVTVVVRSSVSFTDLNNDLHTYDTGGRGV